MTRNQPDVAGFEDGEKPWPHAKASLSAGEGEEMEFPSEPAECTLSH
jgi:hypothetical protein